MILRVEKEELGEKPVPVPLCPPQFFNYTTSDFLSFLTGNFLV
jgi:hypothetical protein